MNDSDQLFSEFPPVSADEWKKRIIEDLKGKSFDDLIWHTPDGIDVNPFYTSEDLERIKTLTAVKNKPGWEIRQDFVVSNVDDSNSSALEALKGGAESIGFNVSGIEISKEVLLKLSEGINSAETPIHFTGLSSKSWDGFVEWLQMRPNVKGSLRLDIISTDKLKKISKLAESFPDFHFITIRNADGNETVTERITALLEEAKEIVQAASELGLPIKDILSSIRFDVTLSADYFMGIAALRALRQLWSDIAQQYTDEQVPVFIHAGNILHDEEEESSHLNILRATTIAMSAIIGGCDSLALKASPIKGKPDSFCERIFRNIQLLLKHESYFENVNDPAKGSYYVEALTAKMIESVKGKLLS